MLCRLLHQQLQRLHPRPAAQQMSTRSLLWQTGFLRYATSWFFSLSMDHLYSGFYLILIQKVAIGFILNIWREFKHAGHGKHKCASTPFLEHWKAISLAVWACAKCVAKHELGHYQTWAQSIISTTFLDLAQLSTMICSAMLCWLSVLVAHSTFRWCRISTHGCIRFLPETFIPETFSYLHLVGFPGFAQSSLFLPFASSHLWLLILMLSLQVWGYSPACLSVSFWMS